MTGNWNNTKSSQQKPAGNGMTRIAHDFRIIVKCAETPKACIASLIVSRSFHR